MSNQEGNVNSEAKTTGKQIVRNSETTKQAAKERRRRKKTTSIFFFSRVSFCAFSRSLVCVCVCVGRLTAAAGAADSSLLRSTCRQL